MENSQIEIVKKALDLSVELRDKTNELNKMKLQQFKPAPPAPVRGIAQKIPYPKITTSIRFNWLMAFLPLIIMSLVPVVIVWPFIYYFKLYKPKKDKQVAVIKNSQNYINQCASIDADFTERQHLMDQEYERQAKIYQDITLPQYQRELQEWIEKHNTEILRIQKNLDNASEQLISLYNTTKILPEQYQNIETLQYILKVLTTSNYDVKTAIEMYDRAKIKQLEQQRIQTERIRYQLEQDRLEDEARKIQAISKTSNSGFLGRTISTAVGTAIGNKITNGKKNEKRDSKNGKRDLLGSAGCVKGKPRYRETSRGGRVPTFGTMDCVECPIRRDCTRW